MLGLEHLPNDFTSLPIVIHVQQSQAATPESKAQESQDRKPSAAQVIIAKSEDETVFSDAITDAISDAAENAWFRLSSAVKQTVREACIGLLKRTETTVSASELNFEYDDDARFLD